MEEKEKQNTQINNQSDKKNEEVINKEIKKEEKKDKNFFKKKEDLEKKKLEEEKNILNEKLLRISAEMQNMKRRNEEKISNMLKYEGEDFIKNLLPIIDNFERAINMDDTNLEDEVSKFLSGFKMIYGNLNNLLQNYEIKVIDCLNKPFDPNTMDAVLTEEVKDVEPNIVIDVMQKGYIYKDKVIRHAMVKVSK